MNIVIRKYLWTALRITIRNIFQKLLQYREERECGIEMRRKGVWYRDEKKVGVV